MAELTIYLNPSSLVAAVEYEPFEEVLQITFASGRQYEYYDVPLEEVVGLVKADSVGRYFNENIKNHYTVVEL